MIRRLYWLRSHAGDVDLLARFELKLDGTLASEWHSELWRRQLEEDGVILADGPVFPTDGRAFLEALDLVFSQSSRVVVEKLA